MKTCANKKIMDVANLIAILQAYIATAAHGRARETAVSLVRAPKEDEREKWENGVKEINEKAR